MTPPPPLIPGGYILLARKLFDSDLMNRPPLYFKLWVWLIGRAMWKDGDSLKRGQLVTTIPEMQEAMSYYSGYRKITPTKDEIRGAYGALRETGMVTTTKTTRGMRISIVNYETYQTPENYGPRTGNHDGANAETTATPHDREEGLTTKKQSKPLSPEALRLSEKLGDLILLNNPGNTDLVAGKREATVTRWAGDIDKLNRLDGQSCEAIEAVIEWCQADSFWSSNILSGKKLREKFNQLSAKMSAKPTAGGYGRHSETYADPTRGAI